MPEKNNHPVIHDQPILPGNIKKEEKINVKIEDQDKRIA